MNNIIFKYENANAVLATAQRCQIVAMNDMVRYCIHIYNKLNTKDRNTLILSSFDIKYAKNRRIVGKHIDTERDVVTVLCVMNQFQDEITQWNIKAKTYRAKKDSIEHLTIVIPENHTTDFVCTLKRKVTTSRIKHLRHKKQDRW